ncbi:helix-turn-helix domain-containing protein [Paracoccus pacificus]|uniref:Helix-turn-helix domain-containing protein n=1 Tax=Paracoccus pacificus TaxID=1463598 RepID=A0ABW4R4N0_9RHOB
MKDDLAQSRADRDAALVVAERLRRLRKANGLSLRQLADATGTSASFLSQLERGLTGASTSTLIRIANCYGTSISELFADVDTPGERVMRANQRPMLPEMNGQRKSLISRRPLTHFETYISEFEPGASSGDELYSHGDSLEMLLVIQGHIRLQLGDQTYELFKGDNIEYSSAVPHRVVNIGADLAEVIYIISPPTSTATYLDAFKSTGRERMRRPADTPPD